MFIKEEESFHIPTDLVDLKKTISSLTNGQENAVIISSKFSFLPFKSKFNLFNLILFSKVNL
jgi:hypothetical protein